MALERRWVFVAFAAAVAVAVCAFVARSTPTDAAGAPATGGGAAAPRFTLVAGPVGEKQTGAFVIDQETMRLLVYAVDAGRKQLKLVAVRDMSQDVLLSHWNNARPWPEDIRQSVETGEDHGGGEKEPTGAAPE